MAIFGFSFIMPAYNRAFCITNAIDSLLTQDYKNWELLIVDDGSTDETEDLIYKLYPKYFETKQIRYFKLDHYGVSKARNKGIKEAKYDWIAYLDTDNTLCPNYLATFVNAIEKNKESKIFYAQSQSISDKRIIGISFDRTALEKSNFIDLGAFVHQKELFLTLGGFNESLKRLVDWDLILKYTKDNQPVFIPEIVLSYNDSNDIKRITNTENLEQNKKIIQKTYHIQTKTQKNSLFLLKLAKTLHIISRKKYKELRAIELFKSSEFFDAQWYLSTYPDVATTQISAEQHYYKYGWQQGYIPSPLFDGNAYLTENTDVKQANINPLEHYLLIGQYEGRHYSDIITKDVVVLKAQKSYFLDKIQYILAYPMRVRAECDRLTAKLKKQRN